MDSNKIDTTQIHLLVFDTRLNFNRTKHLFSRPGYSFKTVVWVKDEAAFDRVIKSLKDDDLIFVVIHVVSEDISGVRDFAASTIQRRYQALSFAYITEWGKDQDIAHKMILAKIPVMPVYKYHEVRSNLEIGRLIPCRKRDLLASPGSTAVASGYAIMTALEKDEMEKILPLIKTTSREKNSQHLIEHGHLKGRKDKVITYASQFNTGMVDASVLASELILRFKPKVLIMAGVLGGKPSDREINIGDVIIATKVFTIDSGKLTDYGFKREMEVSNTDSAYVTSLKRRQSDIEAYVQKKDSRNQKVSIHFGTIACVRHVIDKKGFFEEEISARDRKALALEMESFGVARAGVLLNTTVLIIKSVMDKTQKKKDGTNKKFAAWTSAAVIEYILKNNLI